MKYRPKIQAAWYNGSWGFRTKLTINNAKVGGASEVFDIGNETGSLSEYSSNDATNVAITAAAAMNSSNYGLSITVNDASAHRGYKNVTKSAEIRYRMYFDPNTITMANGDQFKIFDLRQNGGSFSSFSAVSLKYVTGTGYQLVLEGVNDSSTSVLAVTTNITDAPHYIEFYALAATGSAANNGYYEVWIDGISKGSTSAVDNYNFMTDQNFAFYIGQGTDRDAGTSGTIFYDDVVANSDGATIGPVLTDFPIYVDLSKMPADFHNHVNQTDARDIRVTSGDGTTELPREVVYYNSTTHTGELHFKYTGTLSSSTDTSVYIYYGNSSATDYAVTDTYGTQNVWESNYAAVYHLNETSGHHLDSTANNKDSTAETSLVSQGTAAGKLGGADEFDGSASLVALPAIALTGDTGTIEGWAYDDLGTAGNRRLLGRNFEQASIGVADFGALYKVAYLQGTGGGAATSLFGSTLGWHHYVGSYDGSLGSANVKLIFDGANIKTGNVTGNIANEANVWNIGNSGNGNSDWDGKVDEVRLSTITRSDTWINTQYNDQNSPSTFFTTGIVEEQKGGSILNFAFDEGYGTTAHDTSPNGYTGTLSGATTPAWINEDQCISGKCLYYQGSTAYTSVTTSVSNIQSVSFWVKPKTNSETLVDFDGGTHYLSASSGTITATGFTTPTIYVNGVSGASLVANAWQHVEVTTATGFTGSAITIGKRSTFFLNGFVDEFRIYDYQRSVTQVLLDLNSRNSKSGVAARFGSDINKTLSTGLVGYWKMDENTGTTTNDYSGNGNNSSAFTGTTWTSGKYGSGISFDGANDRVTIPDQDMFSVSTTNQLTVSTWFKPSAVNIDQYIVNKEGSGGYEWAIAVDAAGQFYGAVTNTIGNGYLYVANSLTPLTAGQWYHLVFAVDINTNTLTIFQNGNLVKTDVTPTGTLGSNGTQAVRFGEDGDGSHDVNGVIDEVRIYNRALSPAEIAKLYDFAPGPVGHWKMDENTGTVANDLSGNGNAGTLTSSPSWSLGKFGSAISFTGGSDYVDIGTPTNLGLSGDNAFSIEVWAKPTATRLNGCFVSYGAAVANRVISICSDGSGKIYSVHYSNDHSYSIAWTLATWQHVAIVYDPSTSTETLYVNGVYKEAWTPTNLSLAAGDSLDIGNAVWNNTKVNTSLIDDVKIYNYARTPGQIIEDMNGGHPAPGSPVGSAVGYWKFDEGSDNTCSGGVNDVCNSGSGGSAYDGAQTGMAVPATTTSGWSTDGKFGKALSFDNSNDYISVSPPLNNVVDNWALSAWVKPAALPMTTAAGGTMIMYVGNDAFPGGYGFGIGGDSGSSGSKLIGLFGAVSWINTTYTFTSTSEWYHVVMTRRNGTTYFYVNGVELATTTTATPGNNNDYFTIGAQRNAAALQRHFNGKIDEVKVFASGLTADQVKVLYNQSSQAALGSLSTDSTGAASNSDANSYCPPGQGSTCTGPVAHWKMDENTGTSIQDTTGNSNIGILGGGTSSKYPTWTNGKIGAGLLFDGVDDYISVSDVNSQLDFATNMTLEAWIYVMDTNGGILVARHSGPNGLTTGYEFSYDQTNQRLYLWKSNQQANSNSSILSTNTWYHVAVSVASNVATFYVNGTAQGGGAFTLSANGSNTLKIGGENTGEEFQGKIDNVLAYNYARTPAQVAWDYNRGAPIGWWKMDECTGTSVNDSSVQGSGAAGGKTGTWSGSSGTNTSTGTCTTVDTATAWYNGRNGKFNSSLDFDSSDDVISITNSSAIDLNEGLANGFTFSAWIYPNSDGESGNGRIFHKGADGGITVGTNVNTECHTVSASGGTVGIACQLDMTTTDLNQTFTGRIPIGQWSHIAFSYTNDASDTVHLWINGVSEANTAPLGDLATDTSSFYIGGNGVGVNNTRAFDGQIDDFRIYNYELTAQQIKATMNAGAVRF